ncbi:MAG: hypothetical protein J5611_00425 [Alphaproteobacteria bacterium]|nr:hypothetical protein [Alphaproteobacteria bacterium]
MKKLLFVILALFVFSVRADNTITSKEYVDGQVSNLQTQIPAKNTNTVVMNTGTAGTVGEKAIYDTTAAYGAQSDALVTAGAFNSAVQNALESEFVCIEWQGNVHDNAHCLLYEVRAATANQSPNLFCTPTYLESTQFDSNTGILTNTMSDSRNYLNLYIQFFSVNNTFLQHASTQDVRQPQTIRQTITTTPETYYLRIKHNGSDVDIGARVPVNPSTTYTVLVKAIETNPAIVEGLKMQIMLIRGEYDSDEFIPCGNVYIPQSQ